MALETEVLWPHSGLLCPLAPDLIQKREQAKIGPQLIRRTGIDVINGPVWKRTTDIE